MSLAVFSKATEQVRNSGLVEYYFMSKEVVNCLMQCLHFTIVAGPQRTDTVVCTTGYDALDLHINKLKDRSIDFVNCIFKHVYSSSLASKMPASPFREYCVLNAPLAMSSLASACATEYDKLEETLANPAIHKLLASLMRMLCNMLEDHNFYPLFSATKHKLMSDIVLVMLRTTKKEKDWIATDPQNFVNLALDVCEKQESETCKTEAAKLLEALCDHIDGCLTLVTILCTQTIQYACKGGLQEQLAQYSALAQFGGTSPFITKSTPELLIETCIVVMTDISYLTPRRKDIL